nr:hypothetical protein B0A51_09500 [Rachicladosporium sp. CCFEE 5018]
MSTHRPATDGRTLKPTLAASRTPRTPLAPRVAVAPTSSPGGAVRRPLTIRQDALAGPLNARATPPRQDETPVKDLGNVTPRSSTRKTRVEGSGTPVNGGQSPSLISGRASVTSDRGGDSVSSIGSGRATRPKSLIGGAGRARSPLTTSPGFVDLSSQAVGSIDSRFFHASEARNLEPAPKKVEAKKPAAFFYADGQHEGTNGVTATRKSSRPSSIVSDARTSGVRARTDPISGPLNSPPILSPALSTVSNTSPFFATLPRHSAAARSPSPSKENIHLSYRKGASQIFGSRPSPLPSPQALEGAQRPLAPRTISSEQTPHRKSPSLSSLDSPASNEPRRRSATTLEPQVNTPSPLSLQTQTKPAESPLSPTKGLSDLASDARRERKLLDLEISNSSLLAINASLEREVRRQKSELKRFRRLSRAGRFDDRTARLSEGLSAVGEADEDAEPGEYDADFGLPSGFTDIYDGSSHSEDDDESSSVFSNDTSAMSPSRRLGSARDAARLAKDEERLRKDLERHKELLVQSQMMNQSLKRCTFAAEDMLREGRRALDYHVKTSDVKLGGRVLADGHDQDDALHSPGSGEDVGLGAADEGDDTLLAAEDIVEEQTLGFLDVWQGVGGEGRGTGSLESSDFGDRDSGIEVDKPPLLASTAVAAGLDGLLGADLGRPPEVSRGRPGIRWGNTIS